MINFSSVLNVSEKWRGWWKVKFTVEKKALQQALNRVNSTIETRNTIPILGHVKIETGDGLKLTGTDLDSQVVVTVDAEVEARGAATVDAKLFRSIVSRLKDGNLIEITSGERMTIKSGRSKFTLDTLPVADFPTFPEVEGEEQELDIGDQLKRVATAMSKEEARYYLNGVAMQTKDDGLVLVATDGHRLVTETIEGSPVPPIIIPSKAVNEISKIKGSAKYKVNDRIISVESDNVVYSSKLIEGMFPDWERVIPERPETLLNVTDLKDVVSRVSTVGSTIILTLSEDVSISANQGGDKAIETIDAKWNGEEMKIGLNAKYLADMCFDDAKVYIMSPSHPVRVEFESMPNVTGVIMPMRI